MLGCVLLMIKLGAVFAGELMLDACTGPSGFVSFELTVSGSVFGVVG